MTATFDTLLALDARLVRAGIHPLTPWWQSTLQRFYGGTACSLVARVGRGGAKSHTSVKVGANEIINGDWAIPPGEVHYWAQVSENKTEAAERFRLYEAIFTALGLPYDKSGDAIILPSLRRGVRIMACQVGSVSGFRCFGYAADEAAKWENSDHSANPAPEVIASLDAMAILYPDARSLIISSPWDENSLHETLFQRGNTSDQLAVHAETWVANPAVTEPQCRDKSRGDDRIFSREYAAIPGGTVSSALEKDDVLAAFRPSHVELVRSVPVAQRKAGSYIVSDRASIQHKGRPYTAGMQIELSEAEARGLGDHVVDPAAVAYANATGTRRNPLITIDLVSGFTTAEIRALQRKDPQRSSLDLVVERIAEACKTAGAREVFGDQRESLGLEGAFPKHELHFTSYAWSDTSKDEDFQLLRRWLHDGDISLPNHAQLRKQMLACKAKLLPSGRIRHETSGLDYLSCLITLCRAFNLDALPQRGAFCCTDASSLRGDDFAYVVGRVGDASGVTGIRADLELARSVPVHAGNLAGWPHRGF